MSSNAAGQARRAWPAVSTLERGYPASAHGPLGAVGDNAATVVPAWRLLSRHSAPDRGASMFDEDMGSFLRCQAGWLAELADLMDADPPVPPGNAADALSRLAADLLAKAHEVDGKGFGSSVAARRTHPHPD
jgi:hypothetical protein